MFSDYKPFIFSEDPDKLVKFYTDCLKWSVTSKLEYELDYGYGLEISPGGRKIWLAKHSEVKGKNRDPYRHILNLYTDRVQYWYEEVKKYPGIEIVAEPFPMGDIVPGETRYACTFFDPEKNLLQVIGTLELS